MMLVLFDSTPEFNPDSMKRWLGDSIGHWEGNTLVVKTKNHHPQQKFRAAIRHQILISEGAEITERFTRVANNEILYQFEVNDDEAYKDVWKGEMPLRASQEKSMNMLVMKAITLWLTF